MGANIKTMKTFAIENRETSEFLFMNSSDFSMHWQKFEMPWELGYLVSCREDLTSLRKIRDTFRESGINCHIHELTISVSTEGHIP